MKTSLFTFLLWKDLIKELLDSLQIKSHLCLPFHFVVPRLRPEVPLVPLPELAEQRPVQRVIPIFLLFLPLRNRHCKFCAFFGYIRVFIRAQLGF